MRRRRFAAPLVIALGIGLPCLMPRAALAGEDRATALDLFEQGRTLFKSGDYAAALTKFEAAARMMPAYGVLRNMAECQEKLGLTASAWATWREARAVARDAHESDDEALAARRQEALEPRLSRLTILVPPETDLPQLEVLRDGVVVAREAWGRAIAVDPGPHAIEARAPGRKAQQIDTAVDGDAGARLVLVRPLEVEGEPPVGPQPPPAPAPAPAAAPRAAAPAAAPPAAPTPTEVSIPVPARSADRPHDGGSGQALAGWILGGVGVAGAAAGVAVALVGQGQHNNAVATDLAGHLSDAERMESDANTTKTVGYVVIGAGGAFLVSGLVLLLTAPSSSSGGRSSAGVAVRPWVLPIGGGGATVSTTW